MENTKEQKCIRCKEGTIWRKKKQLCEKCYNYLRNNSAKNKLYRHNYYKANKANWTKWRDENRDKVRKCLRDYYQRNKERINQRERDRRLMAK